MSSNTNHRDIKSTEKVCYNCQHMLWMVGIGAGVRCGFDSKDGKMPPMIPHLKHTCEQFVFRKNDEMIYEKQS